MTKIKTYTQYILLFLMFLIGNTIASFGQLVDIKLTPIYGACDGTVVIDIAIKASPLSLQSFELGTSSLLLNYDEQALSFSAYTPISFDKATSNKAVNANWSNQRYTSNKNAGIFNLVLLKLEGGFNHYTLDTTNYIHIGKLYFKYKPDYKENDTKVMANLDYTSFTKQNGDILGFAKVPEIIVNTPTNFLCEARINKKKQIIEQNCKVSVSQGDTLILSVSPNNAVKSIKWIGPNGFTKNRNAGNVLISNNITGEHIGTYTAEIIGEDGCSYKKSIKVLSEEDTPIISSITKVNATCGQKNGSITFVFPDTKERSHVQFSLDGGKTYLVKVLDNSDSITYDSLATGQYDLYTRWGDKTGVKKLLSKRINNNNIDLELVCQYKIDADSWNKGVCELKVCEGSKLNLSIEPNRMASYQWTGPNGFSKPGNQTNGIVFIANKITQEAGGLYTVVVTNAEGCIAEKSIMVKVIPTPKVQVTTSNAICSKETGSITFNFEPQIGRTHIAFSLNGGKTWKNKLSLEDGTKTYTNLPAGKYKLYTRWGDNSCPILVGKRTIKETAAPVVVAKVKKQPNCGRENGKITFTFKNDPNRTGIRFSLDGGKTYKTFVKDNRSSKTYGGLGAGTYPLFVRWGNYDCPLSLGNIILTGEETYAIPGKIEAEDYCNQKGVRAEPARDVGGGENIGYVGNGDWMEYQIKVATAGTYTVDYRVAAKNASGGIIELRLNGTKISSRKIPSTGAWQSYTTVTSTVKLPAGKNTLRIFAKEKGWNLNWMAFKPTTGTDSQLEDCTSVNISVSANSIQVTNVVATAAAIQILDKNKDLVTGCVFDCAEAESFDLPPGKYLVTVKKYNSAYAQVCEKDKVVTIGSSLNSEETLRLIATPGENRQTNLAILIPQKRDVNVAQYTVEYLQEADEQPTSIYIVSEQVLEEEPKALNYTHEQSKVGNGYYRMKIEYTDGHIDYTAYKLVPTSDVTQLESFAEPALEKSMKVMPNPAQNSFSVNFQAIKDQTYRLVIIDLLNKVHHEEDFKGEAGSMKFDLNTSNWEGGIYFLLLESDLHTEAQQVVILK